MKPIIHKINIHFTVTKLLPWRFFVITTLALIYTTASIAAPVTANDSTGCNAYIEDSTLNKSDIDIEYEETSITLYMPQVGSIEVPAMIYGKKIYLSVPDVFDFLKIKNHASIGNDSLSGFFIDPAQVYLIDNVHSRITVGERIFKLKTSELVRKGLSIYLDIDRLQQIFGLNCLFNFRDLSVTMMSKILLPVLKEKQLETMRQNLKQFKREIKADTVIKRRFHFVRLGMADWSVGSTQQSDGKTNSIAGIRIGAILAGGELDLSLNYNNQVPFSQRQQFYQWRYVDNSNKFIRQIAIGKIFVPSISSLYAPVNGISISNTATTYKRSFGTYTLSNTTGANWTVELYMNNILIDFTKADASGFYSFEVPLVFGSTAVKLKFYGPFGEEQTTEKYINIPFNFIALHQLEYNVTVGKVDNDGHALYGKASLNYGLSNYVTIGGGVEYLSSTDSGKYMPFINASARIGQHALFSVEYVYGVRTKATLNYRLPSSMQLDLNYIHYNKEQQAVKYSYSEEKRIALTMPFKGIKSTIFSRLSIARFTTGAPEAYKKVKLNTNVAECLVSAVFAGINANLTTTANSGNYGKPLVYTDLAVSFHFPFQIKLTPQTVYSYTDHKFSMIKVEAEKSIFNRGFLNMAYQKYFDNTSFNAVSIGLRYNFSFAQSFFSATKTSTTNITTQSARGSLIYNGASHSMQVSSQGSVGKGGVLISPFLDLNNNGIHDVGEPKAAGLDIHLASGKIKQNKKDTAILITELEAYANCLIELDKTNFENVAWQIKKKVVSIDIEPNTIKLLEVPVSVLGEVSGTVLLDNGTQQNGIARIVINIYDDHSKLIAKTLSESDGYFSYIGLAPGNYTTGIDAAQLKNIGMKASPALHLIIKENKEGDIVDGMKFILKELDK